MDQSGAQEPPVTLPSVPLLGQAGIVLPIQGPAADYSLPQGHSPAHACSQPRVASLPGCCPLHHTEETLPPSSHRGGLNPGEQTGEAAGQCGTASGFHRQACKETQTEAEVLVRMEGQLAPAQRGLEAHAVASGESRRQLNLRDGSVQTEDCSAHIAQLEEQVVDCRRCGPCDLFHKNPPDVRTVPLCCEALSLRLARCLPSSYC
jgi:hypothetical protein